MGFEKLTVHCLICVCLLLLALHSFAQVPDQMQCVSAKTVGLHDYPLTAESYEPVVFEENSFSLKLNKPLMKYLPDQQQNVVYFTFRNANKLLELTCRPVTGARKSHGLSCTDTPPAEMILINSETLRFSRSSIGGWTFSGAKDGASGNSLFVEYGQCEAL